MLDRTTPEGRVAYSRYMSMRMRRPDTRAKCAAGRIGKQHTAEANQKNREWHVGRHLSPEQRAKIGAAGRGRKQTASSVAKRAAANRGRKRSVESRNRMSLSQIRAIQDGRAHPEHNGTRGYYYSEKNRCELRYRSLLERRWYQRLEQLTIVTSYRPEPVAIAYDWNGSVHHYLPDLWVEYSDGEMELIEVRPEKSRADARSEAKFRAAQQWCANHADAPSFRLVGYAELCKEAS